MESPGIRDVKVNVICQIFTLKLLSIFPSRS